MAGKSERKELELALSEEQIRQLERLTGVRMEALVVETEPFDDPPLGTTVLGKIYVEPQSKVVHRINARLKVSKFGAYDKLQG